MFFNQLIAGLGWIFSSWRRVLAFLAGITFLYTVLDPEGARQFFFRVATSIFHAVEPVIIVGIQLGMLVGAVRLMWTGKLFGGGKKKH